MIKTYFLFSVCKASLPEPTEPAESAGTSSSNQKPGSKRLDCPVCGKVLYLSSIEILKHRKSCTKAVKEEIE